jgi:hypothetical protein
MPRHTRRLQKQAASLFLLAEDAFGRGQTQLGEELTSLWPCDTSMSFRRSKQLHPRAAEPERPAV